MSFDILDNLSIKLIDGDRGKNYPKQSDFFDKSDCLFLSAKNVTKAGFEFTDCSFISKEKDQQLRAGKLERNDIVLTTRGTIGNSALYDSSVSISSVRINSGMIILRPDTNIWNPRFLYFLLNSDFVLQQISALTSGSAVPQLPARDLKKFILPRVSLDKQHKIVEIIGSIVDKIRVSKAINQTLEQMAQTLFKSWFVDFEPVKAKIAALETGGSQEDATLAAMTAINGKDTDALVVFEREHPEQYAELKATAELFPSAMQDSELGEIPEGWNVSNIKDNVDVRDGTHASPKASDSGYHLVTSKNITSGYLDRRSCYYISDADYNDVNKRSRVSCGDILISMIGTVGALYFVAENNVDYAIKNIGLIRTSERHDLQAFIFYHLKSKEGANYIQSRLAGTTQKYLSLKQLREIPLVMPTQDVLAAFNKKTFLHEIHANQEIAETLASIRDTLLPKLLSGEITLPEAEQAVSEAENV
ncbi:restriction endonuclease subunit S [Enterobacter roggenkampii]|uniref:restriction endonuclease subunit S n=1 Tax=Enterobacter roggenkampii TaxID=1812935 RepID=UPI002A821A66|nr:restriction endonuclease subunit S [Enterobacter roggenkampii]